MNGRSVVGAVGPDPEPVEIIMPSKHYEEPCQEGFKNILDKEGPKAFAKAVREHSGHLLMDTTWRDAHQSLLATRLRTKDILTIAPATSHILKGVVLPTWHACHHCHLCLFFSISYPHGLSLSLSRSLSLSLSLTLFYLLACFHLPRAQTVCRAVLD